MRLELRQCALLGILLAAACGGMAAAWAGGVAEPALALPGLQVRLAGGGGAPADVSSAIKILLGLTVLSLAPAILMSMTSFIRIVIVLSMLRHALGMPETPPNTVIISLALFLTFFTMSPALQEVNTRALQPYIAGTLSTEAAAGRAVLPLREFMVRQTREQDLALMVELSKGEAPKVIDDISMVQLIPAFMLSELRSAFQIGFVIFLPFLLIDLIVSSALMSLGMMMVPPASISLPLKILMFVLIDGWNLVVRALLGTFS
ncbi:flagellar type III secretion system pore protein FliP [Janthinobacterium sp. P210006]|uniref:flagellar type III secretion system pore protein FliP n=1 Tax=Janthinobacterium sp. P210006 TaxID=3112939 RepID=UPI002E276088|nr:flagellar type III secretion system pore protein FliP [Janthinobacterium sp. P210006]MED5595866.1 flagellar type III secretion system pore protein FliP [Janthinobacterium sp. P210006]